MNPLSRLLVVSLVVLWFAVAPVSAAGNHGPNIANATFPGDGVAGTRGDVTFLWQSGSHTVSATITEHETHQYSLCADVTLSNGSTLGLGCEAILQNGTNNVTFGSLPSEALGSQNVTVTVREVFNESHVTDEQTLHVYVLQKDGDPDEDALSNRREAKIGTEFLSSDTDEDGIEDGAEVDTYGTDPLQKDTDGDGLLDSAEISGDTNATIPDTDGDGLLDGEEVNDYGTNPLKVDTDGDGLPDDAEVNEYDTNPLQKDTDGDGLLDGEEVNVYGTDPENVDTDGDMLSDETELELGTNPTSPLDVIAIVVASLALVAAGVVLALRRAFDTKPGEEVAATNGALSVDETAESSPTVLTDEDRVLQILREHDGQVPQKRLTEETEWSASKVSRLLSRMDDEGTITKITIGRENVIRLGDDDPGGSHAPE